jgi:porphobilinogen synthase
MELFAEMAILHARAGADAVGPASMIDGTVRACRLALDDHGFSWVNVMPHMIFRSPFYYLYRSIMKTGDGSSRSAFQIDPFQPKECFRSLDTIIAEGANSVLIEPALFVLDLLQRISTVSKVPIGCFSVSGEYELMKYGPLEPSRAAVAAVEFCRAAKRAGVEFIATYAALQVGELLKEKET